MSGGHFDYQESYLGYIAEQIEHDVKFNDLEYDSSKPTDAPYGFQHKPETLEYLKKIVDDLQSLRVLIRAYDYAVSGDSSIESFLDKARLLYRKDGGTK
ncbi:MAG TPA: hypothetical protein ENH10_08160 [Bacteroidetes bacterium]|nr:hypothetical protein [Bacteroidota bacterium]HEX05111.1 hypothetical protein [Bacteroidota bacterium]